MTRQAMIRALGAPWRLVVKAAMQALAPLPTSRSPFGGWYPIVREPYPGAWQKNDPVPLDNAMSNPTLFACVTLIMSDIAKLRLALVQQDAPGVWTETVNPAFTPVLRKPNRYQVPSLFVAQWLASKLMHGNTYVLKERDYRGVVVSLYVLDPTRVVPLVSPDGSIFYQLNRDILAELTEEKIAVPASEIIQDVFYPLFHPLCGVTPIFAAGSAAMQANAISTNSTNFFSKGSHPGGILTAPASISAEQAQRIKDYWNSKFSGDNAGQVAILGDGMTFSGLAVNAVDAELIKQLQWTDEKICSVYHVPGFMVGVGPMPPYANAEPLVQQYYAQCLQTLITTFEQLLDDGLGLTAKINGTQYGTQFDVDDLIWMDSETRSKSAQQAAGTLSPNEARAKFYGVGAVAGGDSPMVQQQYYSLEALAKRDAGNPFAPVATPPALPPAPPPTPTRELTVAHVKALAGAYLRDALEDEAA
jgi:HK97 family phage portal protein